MAVYQLNNIKMNIGYHHTELIKKVEKMTGARVDGVNVVRRSVDARDKNDIHYVLTLAVVCESKLKLDIITDSEDSLKTITKGLKVKGEYGRIAVIGSGPAGLFAALTLANAGVEVDIFERGDCVENRSKAVRLFESTGELSTESNIQFGEGGAGTFSDGKLNTGTKSPYIKVVLREFVRHGADADIEYTAKPHIGTDVLRKVVVSMREELTMLGCKVHFNSKVTDFVISGDRICGLVVGGVKRDYSKVILAVGHSARDTYEVLVARGVFLEPKPFAIGARIEHEQDMIDLSQYGRTGGGLPPAEYKLSAQTKDGRGCYTFCMCPGGEIVAAASEIGGVVTNGMSERSRDGIYANSAILVGVTPKDYGEGVLAGVEFQRRLERLAYDKGEGYAAPYCNTADFIKGRESRGSLPKTSYSRGVYGQSLSNCLTNYVICGMIEGISSFGRKIKGFDTNGVLIGVETRSSAPIKIVRDDSMQCNILGIYPAGEGAGYAGGITSAAVDGIKVALALLRCLKP